MKAKAKEKKWPEPKWRCSGYGFFPGGKKCKGCGDCEGRFLKRGPTVRELRKIFDKNHTMISITKKKK